MAKVGKTQLKTKLLSQESMDDEGFHMEVEGLSPIEHTHMVAKANSLPEIAYEEDADLSLDRICSIDSMKSVGSVVVVESTEMKKTSSLKQVSQAVGDENSQSIKPEEKKCKFHQDMNATWICSKCHCDVCELCSMSKMGVTDPMICHHCHDERVKDMNMIWLVVGALFLGLIFPPLLVAAPIVIIMRSNNPTFKKIGWILFWSIIVLISLFVAGVLITALALRYTGFFKV